jgi:hypothetical protein
MTIEELRKEKVELEDTICTLIDEFEKRWSVDVRVSYWRLPYPSELNRSDYKKVMVDIKGGI